jgi:uncharacterized protein YoxC
MPVSEIFSIILMGAASILCLALVFFLNKITKSITNIEESVSGLSMQFVPVINNITEMTEKLNVVTEELKQPVSEVIDIVDQIKERIDVIFDFEEKIRTNLGANLSGIFSGVKTFWETYKHNGNGTPHRTVIIK